MKKRAWPLPRLLESDRNAVTIFAALQWLAGDKRQLGTTRARIREVCHLSEKCITSAMSVLSKARWIDLSYGRSGQVTWYRVVLPVGRFLPVGRKTTYREGQARVKNDLQGNERCGAKNDPLPLTGKGAVPAAPSLPVGAAPAPTTKVDQIERERLEQIRAKRLAHTNDEAAVAAAIVGGAA